MRSALAIASQARFRLLLAAAATGLMVTAAWASPPGSFGSPTADRSEFYGVATDYGDRPRATPTPCAGQHPHRPDHLRVAAISTGRGNYNWLNFDGSVIHAAPPASAHPDTARVAPSFGHDRPLRPPLDYAASQRACGRTSSAPPSSATGPAASSGTSSPLPAGARPLPPRIAPSPRCVWQAWNEPNLAPFWQPHPSPGDTRISSADDDAVNEVDPGATADHRWDHAGALGVAEVDKAEDFISSHVPAGAAPSFDGLDLHPYRRSRRRWPDRSGTPAPS